MDTWVQVDKFQDGDSINSEVLNTPIEQLADRTEYLKRKLAALKGDGFQSALILSDVDLAQDEADKMAIGSIVYLPEDGGFRLAQAKMHLYDSFVADATAFTIGVLVDKTGTTGDVLIYGKLDLGDDSPLLVASNMLQSGETFKAGRYYLSADEPGKITAHPNGPLIYIGSFHSSYTATHEFSSDAIACINPQFMDIGTSHVHRAYPLVARPAGHLDETGKNVLGYLPLDHSDTDKSYPSLVFGGTWTHKDGNKVAYAFSIENNAWGNVLLKWQKDGKSAIYTAEIPAPGVFVDIDNGLKVKVLFPEATSSEAFAANRFEEDELKWNLTFPDAGKGWVNHEVTAIASIAGDTAVDSSALGTIPTMHVRITGQFERHSRDIYCVFPTTVCEETYASVNDLGHVKIGEDKYQFISSGGSADAGYTPVQKASSVAESLINLANIANSNEAEARVLFRENVLYVIDTTLTNEESSADPAEGADFNVIGGTIKLLLVYSDTYEVQGPVISNKETYSDLALSGTGLSVMVYAQGATSSMNYLCRKGTILKAEVYDYAPDAIYDYVMGLHQSIDYYFPPVPAQNAGLFVNGVEVENAALFPDNPTYIIGRKTIHWMEDDVEHLPWPYGVTSHDDIVDPSDDKTIAFYFSVGFQCATGPVTSIVPAPDSPLKIYTYGTKEPAYTGDVMIDAAFDFHVNDANIQGFNVAKQGSGGQLLAGPVVERIQAGNGIIVQEAPGCPTGQGTVTISLDNGAIRDHFTEIALENAKQEKLGLFPYISLLGWNGTYGNIPSAFTMMMRVPTNLDASKGYRLDLKMTMFGTAGFDDTLNRMAGVQLEYNILPDYTGDQHDSLKNGLKVPSSPRQIDIQFGHPVGGRQKYTAYDPFVVATDVETTDPDRLVYFSNMPIPASEELENVVLKPGYLVAIRISRSTPFRVGGDSGYNEYTAPLGFLDMNWELKEVV